MASVLIAANAALWPVAGAAPAAASPQAAREASLTSIVAVLPDTSGGARGGGSRPAAPEGTGVVVARDASGAALIATADHVLGGAVASDVRFADGRRAVATIVGRDPASDVALLRVEVAATPFEMADDAAMGDAVCAVGNVFGLGLSMSCGVVSAVAVSDAGFNAIEDFVQTDAAANPGSSGGALIDADGRLVGMMSAIFGSQGDGDIGVNFAVSARLLARVVSDLRGGGRADYVSAGWRLRAATRAEELRQPGAVVAEVAAGGAAAAAGVRVGDVVVAVEGRRVLTPRDALSALALVRPGGVAEVALRREGADAEAQLAFGAADSDESGAAPQADTAAPASAECPHPAPVCAARRAVFPVSGFDPLASAVRIGPDLLVTNRHVVGDQRDVAVMTPSGPVAAEVLPSNYAGDLAVLRAVGLPSEVGVEGGVLPPRPVAVGPEDQFYAVGADPSRREVRVFAPGALIAPPADGAPLGRLHVTAAMRPGVSGGALVNASGRLVGVAVGGGDGRFEAIPTAQIEALLVGRGAPGAAAAQTRLGAAFAACDAALDAFSRGDPPEPVAAPCAAAQNLGQLLRAGRALGQAAAFDAAVDLHAAAAAQAPNSINARVSLLVSLQLAARFEAMLPHARALLALAPEDSQALRFAIQSGVWGGDPALAEAAYATLATVDPRQAQAARRFLDAPPPAPPPR